MDCAKAKRPANTLFMDLNDVQNITVDDLEQYLGLIISLFQHSPKGAMIDSEFLSIRMCCPVVVWFCMHS